MSLVARGNDSQEESLQTNKPGTTRVVADLSGNLESAVANAFAGWYRSKDKGQGVTIARDTLMMLWGVTLPTLLTWEAALGVTKTANYAQSADTSIENVPAHAYLTKDANGSEIASWRLPNTYHVPETIEKHPHVGNTRQVRESVNDINRPFQPATLTGHADTSVDNGGLLRMGRLYFDDETRCSKHLRWHQDVFVDHYFLLGWRRKTCIYERYNPVANHQQTGLDRDFASEYKTDFIRKQVLYRKVQGLKV